jgi:hypothetical protein
VGGIEERDFANGARNDSMQWRGRGGKQFLDLRVVLAKATNAVRAQEVSQKTP